MVARRNSSPTDRNRFLHTAFFFDGGLEVRQLPLRPSRGAIVSGYDWHVHTTASDGERSPRELASEVFAKGYTVIVADHYETFGADIAIRELARLNNGGAGLPGAASIIPGIEFSTKVDIPSIRQIRKLHIIGAGVDTKNQGLVEWLRQYKRMRCTDIEHALRVRDDLEDRGFRFPAKLHSKLESRRNVYQVLAESMHADPVNYRVIEKLFGFKVRQVVSKRKRRVKNAQTRRRLVKAIRDRYGDFNTAKPHIGEIVDVIKGAGGLAIVAHPVVTCPQLPHFSFEKMWSVFASLKDAGIDGIEAYTPTHRLETADMIAAAALEAGLLVAGGSDSHRRSHEMGRLINGVC